MTAAEIIALAAARVEEVYNNDIWIGFINSCLDDLSPVIKLLKQTTTAVTFTGGVAIIPITGVGAHADLTTAQEFLNVYITPTTPAGGMKRLRRLAVSDFVNEGWKLYTGSLTVQNPVSGGDPVTAATVAVDYYDRIGHVTLVANVPALPVQYHNLIVPYICAKSQQKEEELEDKNDFYAEYLKGKNELALDRMYEMEPHKRKVIEQARIAAKLGL